MERAACIIHPGLALRPRLRVALSWSGGKDSALALARLLEAGHEVALVHLTDAATRRDRAHGVPDFLVEEQAAALALPLHLGASEVAGYEAELARLLREAAPEAVAFGDIRLAEHRAWGERLAARLGLAAMFPLWGEPPGAPARESVARGFRAFVTACRPPLDPSFLGRFLDADLLADMPRTGADPDGENGEYHTLVVDGPPFRRRVDAMAGDVVPDRDGWRLELGLRGC